CFLWDRAWPNKRQLPSRVKATSRKHQPRRKQARARRKHQAPQPLRSSPKKNRTSTKARGTGSRGGWSGRIAAGAFWQWLGGWARWRLATAAEWAVAFGR